MTNSRAKGARGEREAAAYLTKLGFKCSRNGRNGYSSDDLICESLPNVHIEVKFGYANMDLHTDSLRRAWDQAAECVLEGDDGLGNMTWTVMRPNAVVLWRPLRKPWRLTWMEPCGLVTTTGDDAIKTKLLELNAVNAAGG